LDFPDAERLTLEVTMSLTIRSPAFSHEGAIPTRYTCEGEDISPALEWRSAPDATASLALLVEDPDAPDPLAPQTIFTHWLLYNLPPESSGLVENVGPETLPRGARIGENDFGRTRWGGPCPPIGEHRYFFKLYALDTPLPTARVPNRTSLLDAIEGHVLDYAELIGTYRKRRGARLSPADLGTSRSR
jgi:Raf kinase inhibitor-like YbhB/YbcL family protein